MSPYAHFSLLRRGLNILWDGHRQTAGAGHLPETPA